MPVDRQLQRLPLQQLFAKACQALHIKHTFTKPYRPQTNGKAERFIETCLREWAYGRTWANSAERTQWLPVFLAYCNARRPHSALGYKPALAETTYCNSTSTGVLEVVGKNRSCKGAPRPPPQIFSEA